MALANEGRTGHGRPARQSHHTHSFAINNGSFRESAGDRGIFDDTSPAFRCWRSFFAPREEHRLFELTEVRIVVQPCRPGHNDDERLLAFASIVLDGCFKITDLKVVDGDRGPFVAFPSRKVCDHCPNPDCGIRVAVMDRYCRGCGGTLDRGRAALDERGRPKLYADVCHPISNECRGRIEAVVLAAYDQACDDVLVERARHLEVA